MKRPQNPHGAGIPPSCTELSSFEYFAERAKLDTYEGQSRRAAKALPHCPTHAKSRADRGTTTGRHLP